MGGPRENYIAVKIERGTGTCNARMRVSALLCEVTEEEQEDGAVFCILNIVSLEARLFPR